MSSVEKCPVLLVLPYIGVKSQLFEKNTKNIRENTYSAAKPRIIFKSSLIITLGSKDLISKNHSSGVVYTFKCYCESSYIGQTSRHLQTRINEHIPRCVKNYIKNPVTPMSNATTNAIKRSAIAENLINNLICEKTTMSLDLVF